MSMQITVTCKHCGLTAIMSTWAFLITQKQFKEERDKLNEYHSNTCSCRSIVLGIEILRKQIGLSDTEVMWFRGQLVNPVYNILNPYVIERMERRKNPSNWREICNVTDENLDKQLGFYEAISKEIDEVVNSKLSNPDAINGFRREVSESAVLGPLLGDIQKE